LSLQIKAEKKASLETNVKFVTFNNLGKEF
jgi:hypothetical protein